MGGYRLGDTLRCASQGSVNVHRCLGIPWLFLPLQWWFSPAAMTVTDGWMAGLGSHGAGSVDEGSMGDAPAMERARSGASGTSAASWSTAASVPTRHSQCVHAPVGNLTDCAGVSTRRAMVPSIASWAPGQHWRGFHTTVSTMAKHRKTSSEASYDESSNKKVRNKASHKKQKRMEAKAKLNEWRDWCNGQSPRQRSGWARGVLDDFFSYESVFTLTAADRRRASQSRRGRHRERGGTQWVWEWERTDGGHWESVGATEQGRNQADGRAFFERLFAEAEFAWEQRAGSRESPDRPGSRARRPSPSGFRPAPSMPRCPHRTRLDLPQSVPLSAAVVKEAFRKQALKWHPDRHMETAKADAEARFKEAVLAYDALKGTVQG